MRILVIGKGGREHALVWKLASSPHVEALWSAPGNPGMAQLSTAVPIGSGDVDALAGFAERERIDLTIVGPEAPLEAGIVDVFEARGLRAFGPRQDAALIETSKVFMREFAARHGIRLAEGRSFDDPDDAAAYARGMPLPVVVKAEGLAEGKGVIICHDHATAEKTVWSMIEGAAFGDAGRRVVVEEYLEGREISLLCLTDGEQLCVLQAAQDYKKIFEGDRGPNTGGMGSYTPAGWLSRELVEAATDQVLRPAVAGLAHEGRRYVGCLYAGLMIVGKEVYVIEFNGRFGDPEAQVLLPMLETDLVEPLVACVEGTLRADALSWSPDAAVCVALASANYPGPVETGAVVEGLDAAADMDDVLVFHAGTRTTGGRLVTDGGRVVYLVGTGARIEEARTRAYDAVSRVSFDGMQFRPDIAAVV